MTNAIAIAKTGAKDAVSYLAEAVEPADDYYDARLAAEVARALEKRDLAACTVSIKVRYSDFTTISRSRSFRIPVFDGAVLAACARDLLVRTQAGDRPVRLLGVTASNLVRERVEQLSLFV